MPAARVLPHLRRRRPPRSSGLRSLGVAALAVVLAGCSDAPSANDPEVQRAAAAAESDLAAAETPLLEALQAAGLTAVPLHGEGDECTEGIQDAKRDDPFALRCKRTSVRVLRESAQGAAVDLQAVRAAVQAAGYQPRNPGSALPPTPAAPGGPAVDGTYTAVDAPDRSLLVLLTGPGDPLAFARLPEVTFTVPGTASAAPLTAQAAAGQLPKDSGVIVLALTSTYFEQ